MNHWKSLALSAHVTFRYKEHESPAYVEIEGLDTTYRILPDAVVATEKIDGMQTMWIAGWQAYRANKGHFGSSHYSKNEALYFRMETNPKVGETKEGLFRSAGHPIYEHNEGGKIIRYFLNSKGTQKTVDEDAWLAPGRVFHLCRGVGFRKGNIGNTASILCCRSIKDEVEKYATKSYDPKMELQVPGEPPKPLNEPDREVMILVDTMLGQVSCILVVPRSCFLLFMAFASSGPR